MVGAHADNLAPKLAAWLGLEVESVMVYGSLKDILELNPEPTIGLRIVVNNTNGVSLDGWEKALDKGHQLYQFDDRSCNGPSLISLADLLSSSASYLNNTQAIKEVQQQYQDKRVLITGAAGSIGSELAKQIALSKPALLVLVDVTESPLVDLSRELMALCPTVKIIPKLQDVCHSNRLDAVFSKFKPEIVFHTAAYKHVPLLQEAVWAAVNTNIWGTFLIGKLSLRYNVDRVVLLSTDKAVQPTCLMGATKYVAEQWVSVMAQESALRNKQTKFMTMRFGNVIGSRGSVLPLWETELANQQPITITDPTMERFFISVADACHRMLQAGAMGENGGLYGFWMPTYTIGQLASWMLRINGKPADYMRTVGMRPGERIKEQLLAESENLQDDLCPEVFRIAHPNADVVMIKTLTANLIEGMRFCLDHRLWSLMLEACPSLDKPTKQKLMAF